MSDDIDVQMAKVHQEIATHNSELAVKRVEKTREELLTRIELLEGKTNQLEFQLTHLHQKYNLLLSERFNHGPTE